MQRKRWLTPWQPKHKAIKDRDQAVTASNRAQAESNETRAAYDAIGPELDKAKELDAKIDTATSDVADWKSFWLERTPKRMRRRMLLPRSRLP
jgi:hypothetical protein